MLFSSILWYNFTTSLCEWRMVFCTPYFWNVLPLFRITGHILLVFVLKHVGTTCICFCGIQSNSIANRFQICFNLLKTLFRYMTDMLQNFLYTCKSFFMLPHELHLYECTISFVMVCFFNLWKADISFGTLSFPLYNFVLSVESGIEIIYFSLFFCWVPCFLIQS